MTALKYLMCKSCVFSNAHDINIIPIKAPRKNYCINPLNLLLMNTPHFHLTWKIDSQLTLYTSGLSRNNGNKYSMKGNSGSCNTSFKIKYWRNLAQTESLITYCLNFIQYQVFENQFDWLYKIGFWCNEIEISFDKLAVEMHNCEDKMTNFQCK